MLRGALSPGRLRCTLRGSDPAAWLFQTATVTRKNVAGIEVVSASGLSFCALKSASSSFCELSGPPVLFGGFERVHRRPVVVAELRDELGGRAGEVEAIGVSHERDVLRRDARAR